MTDTQLDMFPHLVNNFDLSQEDVFSHGIRMQRQVKDKSGAINRLMKARFDDMISAKLAEENLKLREEIALLKKLLEKSA